MEVSCSAWVTSNDLSFVRVSILKSTIYLQTTNFQQVKSIQLQFQLPRPNCSLESTHLFTLFSLSTIEQIFHVFLMMKRNKKTLIKFAHSKMKIKSKKEHCQRPLSFKWLTFVDKILGDFFFAQINIDFIIKSNFYFQKKIEQKHQK